MTTTWLRSVLDIPSDDSTRRSSRPRPRRRLSPLVLGLSVLPLALTWLGQPAYAQAFRDVTQSAGLGGITNASWAAAWADYDGDGLLDVLITGHFQTITGATTQLWRNRGDGTFENVTAAAGLKAKNGDPHGTAWADLDDDGRVDLVIVKGSLKTDADPTNKNELWRNNGDGTFTDVANQAGATGIGHRGRGVYAIDVRGGGRLDLFVSGFARHGDTDSGNLLMRNNGDGTFTDVAERAGLRLEHKKNRTAAWADFNNDGFLDVFITYPCTIFLNRENGVFVDVTASAGIAPLQECASGAWGDFDGDGHLDLYVTMSSTSRSGILYRNNGDGTFTDVTVSSGAINTADALGVAWGDYDNDGHLDLYIVNTDNRRVPNRLFRNRGDGTFVDVTSVTGTGAQVKGGGTDGMFVDYNNDGFLDLFVVNGVGNRSGRYVLFQNTANTNHWLKMQLVGTTSNRDAVGAKVFVTTGGKRQFRHNIPSHYMAQDKIPIHFGVGTSQLIDRVEIHWPSGRVEAYEAVAADRMVTYVEGQASAP